MTTYVFHPMGGGSPIIIVAFDEMSAWNQLAAQGKNRCDYTL